MVAEDHLLTTAEVANMLRVSDSTVRYWRHIRVGPPSFRARRHVLYWRADVLAWITDQQKLERRQAS